ncbi:MAG TPA: type II toxin-antitoxin system VapC family toxin [Gammaproteobacteria bacterium]|nr:type II toxin-antitoxin system VapC family toxin [Gammaproteobacteria bacterium]
MKLLLDTCAFLWVIEGGPALSAAARTAIRDTGNEVFLSVASVWEIVQKNVLGKLPLPESPERFVTRYRESHGIAPLPLEESAVFHLRRLPALHRDPFDRMLICQALAHGLSIVTPDTLITQYAVPTLW